MWNRPQQRGAARPSRLRRTLLALLLIVALVAVDQYRRDQRRERLIAAIQSAGGAVDSGSPLINRLRYLVQGVPVQGMSATLAGERFDDDWLSQHDDLRSLPISVLRVEGTAISGPALGRLIGRHWLEGLQLIDNAFSHDTVTAISEQARLRHLHLSGLPLTDDGLSELPLESVNELLIGGTQVTAAGMHHLQRCERLRSLEIDVKQLDKATVVYLRLLPQLEGIQVVGDDVTDEHVRLFRGMVGLRFAVFDGDRVSAEALEELERSIPGCVTRVRLTAGRRRAGKL